jgi:hypothetical protein
MEGRAGITRQPSHIYLSENEPWQFDAQSGIGMSTGRVGAGLGSFDSIPAFINGAPGCQPHQCSKKPETSGSDEEPEGPKRYPPLATRIPLALVFGLGSNGVLVWGLLTWEAGRRFLGVVLCCLAVTMFLTGSGIALVSAFPATWEWWL